jgi:hypothetical protein
MAQRGRLCHASLARCSQNLRHRILCKRGGGRSSTKAGLGAGCPSGHRPCVDRNHRPSIGYCRLRDHLPAIPPGFLAGSCRTCDPASFENAIDACAIESEAEPNAQTINPLGIGTSDSRCRWGCGFSCLSRLAERRVAARLISQVGTEHIVLNYAIRAGSHSCLKGPSGGRNDAVPLGHKHWHACSLCCGVEFTE